jgi:predicted double-glycine peptidase
MHLGARRLHPPMCWLVIACTGFTLLYRQTPCAGGPASFRDLRYRGTVPQTTDYSCGAAAVACLLDLYYGISTTEQEILELAERQILARGETPGLERGLTAYDLKAASATKGLPMAGYEVTRRELEDYFGRGGLPLIAHVTRPRLHYLVVIGVVDGHVLLSDPGLGRVIAPLCELEDVRAMSGVILVPLPNAEQILRVRREQKLALEWMCSRVSQLNDLRESMP